MPQLLLVRHAQSTWNSQGRWQGHADPPLSDEGERTAKAAGLYYSQKFPQVSSIVSSPLLRAKKTAEILAECYPGVQVKLKPELMERDLGEWEGLTRAEVDKRWPGYLSAHKWPDGAETTEVFKERVFAALRQVASELEATATCIITAHAGVIINLEQSLGVPWRRVGNLCGREVLCEAGEIKETSEIKEAGKIKLGKALLFEPPEVPNFENSQAQIDW